MKAKTFDCVQMKRRGAELVRKQLEGKSFEQQLEYWQKGTQNLKEIQTQARKRRRLSIQGEKWTVSFSSVLQDES